MSISVNILNKAIQVAHDAGSITDDLYDTHVAASAAVIAADTACDAAIAKARKSLTNAAISGTDESARDAAMAACAIYREAAAAAAAAATIAAETACDIAVAKARMATAYAEISRSIEDGCKASKLFVDAIASTDALIKVYAVRAAARAPKM